MPQFGGFFSQPYGNTFQGGYSQPYTPASYGQSHARPRQAPARPPRRRVSRSPVRHFTRCWGYEIKNPDTSPWQPAGR